MLFRFNGMSFAHNRAQGHPARFGSVCRSLAILWAIASMLPGAVYAAGPPTIVLSTSRYAALSDGRDSLEIIAEVRDGSGRFVPDGTVVTFSTNLGLFADAGGSARAETRSGTARIRISSQQKGAATLTASVTGGGFQRMEVLFTDDPADTIEGNAYVSVESSGTLIYAAAERTIEAIARIAKEGEAASDVRLTYRNLEIRAERLQIDCSANVVRASGSVRATIVKKGLRCARLYYNLLTGKAYAIVEKDRTLEPVTIAGRDLAETAAEQGVAPKYFEMADLAEAKLIIAAHHIRLFPGDKLQFRRPRFYDGGDHLFTLAYYSLSLYSTQLFTDQLLTLGTEGVGVDLPLYYDLTPVSKGLVRVRYGERYGSAYAIRPGFALDVLQSYAQTPRSGRYSGEYGFTGLTRSDWGFRWTHSQEFGTDTLTSLHFDLPQHRSVFGSGNISHRLGNFRLGLSGSAHTTLTGPTAVGSYASAYLETRPAKIKGTPAMIAVGGTATTTRTSSAASRTYTLSEGLQVRMFTPSIQINRATSLTTALTVGHLWNNTGTSGSTTYATIGATRSLGGSSALNLAYDYVHLPVASVDGSHRVSLSLGTTESRWGLYLYNTYMLDTQALSFIGDLQFTLAPRWRFGISASVQEYVAGGGYSELIFGLARNIGGRDIVLSYSTYLRKVMLNLEAAHF
ncbi:MAG: hypothetical protein HUU17_03175 [Chthonomonadales bacterium]|nr:hypothetical protein [Chthonomonadales bacterium]